MWPHLPLCLPLSGSDQHRLGYRHIVAREHKAKKLLMFKMCYILLYVLVPRVVR